MTERKPAFWLIRKSHQHEGQVFVHTDYWVGPSANLWTTHRNNALRFGTRRSAVFANTHACGRIVPVYVTTRMAKRGHSWAWACKRMLEGKSVRASGWRHTNRLNIGKNGIIEWVEPGFDNSPFVLSIESIEATDWELAEYWELAE